MRRSIQEQLIHFLSDMYSVEQQALVQMKAAPQMAGAPTIAEDFRNHYRETEHHAELIRERLEAHGASPSAIKDAIMRLGGVGFLLFARLQPETPGRLVDHAYSYEAMEWAGYQMLMRFAEQADDHQTVEVAQKIGAEELAMMQRLKGRFDAAEQITHRDIPQEKMQDHLKKHLAEVHAFENQSIQLLKKGKEIGGNHYLDELYRNQLYLTDKHADLIEQHLKALDAHASKFKDSALAASGLNWGFFFQYQSDTPAKLAAFVYAVLHLKMGGYELLKRTARRCQDLELVSLCDTILAEKQAVAKILAEAFDSAAQATIDLLKHTS